MIVLNESKINDTAPYHVVINKDGYATFTTNNGLHYIVGFDPDDASLSLLCYQLVIINSDNKPSPRDKKLRDTVISIVKDFFEGNNEVVLYICETGDGKQAMRNRLFQFWYSRESNKLDVTYLSAAIQDEEGVTNYVTIIMRNDNPNYTIAYQNFGETIQLLNNKPKQ